MNKIILTNVSIMENMYCKHWIVRSKRYCKNTPLPNTNYCRIHKVEETLVFDEIWYNILINVSDPYTLSSLFRSFLSMYKLYRNVAVWKKIYSNSMPHFNGEVQLKYFNTVNIKNPMKKYRELLKYHHRHDDVASKIKHSTLVDVYDTAVIVPSMEHILNISIAKELLGYSYSCVNFRVSRTSDAVEYSIMTDKKMIVNIDQDKFISYLTMIHTATPRGHTIKTHGKRACKKMYIL